MKGTKSFISILYIIFFLLIIGGLFVYFKKPNIVLPFKLPFGVSNVISKATNQQSQPDDNKKTLEQVGKLIQLPQGEEPVLGVITDVSKLQDQPFFKKGRNGDKILFYTASKKVILYDPNLNQIVDVAPIIISSASAQPVLDKITIWNGTTTTGLANKVQGEINKNFSQSNIISTGNTSSNNYDKTIVIAFSDSAKQSASNLARLLNAQLTDLPSGETKPPNTDILVIVGKDQI